MGMFNFIGDWRNKLNSVSPVNVRKFVDAPITQLTGLNDRQLHPLESGADEWATQHDQKYRGGGSYGQLTDAATIAAMTMGAGAAAGAGAGSGAGVTTTASTAPAAYGSYGAGAYGTTAGYGGANAAYAMPSTTATQGGLLGGMKTAGEYAETIGQSADAASSVRGLLSPRQSAPMQAPQNNSAQGAQVLAQLAQNPQGQQLAMADQMRRQRRSLMWG